MSDAEAGPSSQTSRSTSSSTRPRSSAARPNRSRIRGRASSSLSSRSDSSTISNGVNRMSWATGDCYDYVDSDQQISAFLQCPICLGPFLDPYVSDVCSHTFCKRCITLALAPSRSEDEEEAGPSAFRCPTCRNKVQLDNFKPTALLIKNMVDTLRVSCPNKVKGCAHSCERHLLRSHVARECEFEYVDQDLNLGKRCGCSEKVMRKDWANHGLTCPKRRVQCSTCDVDLAFDQLDEHCKICSPEPVWCSHCQLQTIKSRLPLHIADCPCAPVPCIHVAFGCCWTGPRWQLQPPETAPDSHLTQCRLEPLKAFFAVFTQQFSDLKNENVALRHKLEEMESRQRSQIRRIDDVMHSLGSWYRSAGDGVGLVSQGPRGSQAGVDGEWDEFPLDTQNWERSMSQSNVGSLRRFTRSQSASAALVPDQIEWLNQRPISHEQVSSDRLYSSPAHRLDSSYFGPILPTEDLELNVDSRPLLSQSSRSLPSSSRYDMTSANLPRATGATSPREPPIAPHRRSMTASVAASSAREPGVIASVDVSVPNNSTQFGADGMDRTNLDSALTSLGASVHGLTLGLSNLDKRSEDSHITAVKASFESARAQEEVQSLRHGLHAVRMQIHQLLMMQQQRYAMFSAPSPATASASGSIALPSPGVQPGLDQAGPAQQFQPRPAMRDAALPLLTPPLLMRRWGGFDQTKL